MGKGRNFIILEEAYWIFLIPVLNILDCFELEIACLMVKYRRTINFLDVLTQYEILVFCRSSYNRLKFYRTE